MSRFEAPSLLALTLLGSGAALLTGCAADGGTSSPTVTVTQTVTASPEAAASPAAETATPSAAPASPTPVSAAEGSFSPRGALVKKPGEMAGLTTPDGESIVEFTINDISTEVTCTEPDPTAPENGSLVALEAELEVFPGADDQYVDGEILNGGRFRFIGEDGETFSGDLSTLATYSCIPIADLLKTDIGEGEKSSGVILLDVPTESGVLLLEEPMSGNKWEWEL